MYWMEVCEDFSQKELKFKSLSPPTKEIRESKDVLATLKKKKKLYLEIGEKPWKYHGEIMEFCHHRKVGTL